MGLVGPLHPQLLQLALHRLYGLQQLLLLAQLAHHEGEGVVEPS